MREICLIFLLSVFVFLSVSGIALAQIQGPVTGGNLTLKNPLGTDNIIQIISNVIDYLIYIGVPIFALMILIGGFQILTAREDPNRVKSGRQTIMWATIGFAIILIAKGIALILLQILGG